MDILDLGCGTKKVDGAIGVDKAQLPGVDVVWDLEKLPYPFKDNSFDKIHLLDVIEHLPDTIAVMEEVFRLCRPNASVHIRVVNWNHHYTHMDPTHVKGFTENSFDFFGTIPGRTYYTQARFNVVKIDYIWDPKARKLFKSVRLMKFLSRYLCNVLDGFNFELKAIKTEPDKS